MQKEQEIALIKGRIIDEQRKHPDLDWQEIAARKIYSQRSEYFEKEISRIKHEHSELELLYRDANAKLLKQIEDLSRLDNDCTHENTEFKHIRWNVCLDCGDVIEIDV